MLNRTKKFEKRRKEELDEMEKGEKVKAIENLKREVDLLKAELDVAYDLQDKADKNAELLEKLFTDNIIDEEGNVKNSVNFTQDNNNQ